METAEFLRTAASRGAAPRSRDRIHRRERLAAPRRRVISARLTEEECPGWQVKRRERVDIPAPFLKHLPQGGRRSPKRAAVAPCCTGGTRRVLELRLGLGVQPAVVTPLAHRWGKFVLARLFSGHMGVQNHRRTGGSVEQRELVVERQMVEEPEVENQVVFL